jgi:hypothetical protein
MLVDSDREAKVILWPESCLLDERSQREADEGRANRLGDAPGSTPDRGSTCAGIVRRPPRQPAD